MRKSKRQIGVSLIEIMLALGIISAIITVGYSTYISLKRDSDAITLRSNIDILARATAGYYYANCYGLWDSGTNTLTPGSLHPASNPQNPTVLNISTDLYAKYLPSQIDYNSIAISSSAGNPLDGYIVQLREYRGTRYTCTSSVCSGASKVAVGTIVAWKIEIGVQLNDPSKSDYMKNVTGATCATDISDGVLTSCASTSGGNGRTHLLFERLPAQPTTEPSIMWQNNIMLMNTVQFYRTPSAYYSLSLPSSSASTYILCSS